MNNVTFGGMRDAGNGMRDGWTYYETIGGGQGASPGADGPSGVHVGMSNTRNTPIEVLELEHPLRVRTYALRRGSGGAGKWVGGDGVVREFEALAPMDATLLTERRRHGGCGAAGGSPGAPGANLKNGAALPAKVTLRLAAGDVLRIETPGGGGWGNPEGKR
jgi:N-methylhydantoinase B